MVGVGEERRWLLQWEIGKKFSREEDANLHAKTNFPRPLPACAADHGRRRLPAARPTTGVFDAASPGSTHSSRRRMKRRVGSNCCSLGCLLKKKNVACLRLSTSRCACPNLNCAEDPRNDKTTSFVLFTLIIVREEIKGYGLSLQERMKGIFAPVLC